MGLDDRQLLRHVRQLAVGICALPVIVLALAQCGGTTEPAAKSLDDAGASSDAQNVVRDAVAPCAFPTYDAAACDPASCFPFEAMELNRNSGCRRKVVLGCVPWGGYSTDAPCFRYEADGRLVTASGSLLYGRAGWAVCTAEESKEMAEACVE